MIVTDVEAIVVKNPPPRFGGRYFIFVKLTTDSGIVGWGESYVATVKPQLVTDMIVDVAERWLIGRNPFEIERFWHRAHGSGYSLRPDITLDGVISGLEIACWDIVGKELNRPVYELLGGKVHDRLRSYTYLYPDDSDDVYGDGAEENDVYVNPDAAAAKAVEAKEAGFTAVKFDPAGPYTVYDGHQPSMERLELSERFCRAIREAVGHDTDLLFGTHGQFTPSGALRLARRIEPYDPLWLEEPTTADDPIGMATVAKGTSIPIATGERLTGISEFARLLELRAAAILQPDLGRSGGILQGKKIAAMAQAFGAQIAPHCYCGPIVAAANIQLASCIPNLLIVEAIRDYGGFYADVLTSPIEWHEGDIIPPTAPGIGVEIDEAVARANLWTDADAEGDGDGLHLQMLPDAAPHKEGLL